MVDGRIHTPQDELEVLDHDIRTAERRLDDLGRERARVVSEPEIGQAMWRLEERLQDDADGTRGPLARLLAQATPPLRIAGIPPGIISATDWDVTDEILALAPDGLRLLVDMADALALARGYIPTSEQFGALDLNELLARFAELEARAAA